MSERDVRFPYSEFLKFLELDPEDDEVEIVSGCLASLKIDPEQGEPIPFAQYHEYPHCRAQDCGRFLIVYSFTEEQF
jgi:hypothetical protein